MIGRDWLVVLAATVLHFGCGGSAPPAQPSASPAPPPAAAAPGFSHVSGTAPAGALVALEPTGGATLPMPDGGALMDQYAKQFVPTLLFVRVGQPVTFRNSEDQLHDVTIIRSRTGATVFNTSQDPFHENLFTFDNPGEFDVICDVHPGMRATIVATTTPYAIFADAAGRYALPQVAHGTYTLQITSAGQTREERVEIAGATVELEQ